MPTQIFKTGMVMEAVTRGNHKSVIKMLKEAIQQYLAEGKKKRRLRKRKTLGKKKTLGKNKAKQFKNILPNSIMQTIETQINKLETIVAEIDRINADLKEHMPDSEQFQNGIYKILELIEDEEVDDYDYDSDDSDISFTEEERELIESEDHYAFLKRYSLKPTAEMPFVPLTKK